MKEKGKGESPYSTYPNSGSTKETTSSLLQDLQEVNGHQLDKHTSPTIKKNKVTQPISGTIAE